MNTQKPQALPKGWEALFASRWQRGKFLNEKQTTYYYTIWERIQIRGREENPDALTLYVHGISNQWQKAGTLKRQGERWIFEPAKTNDTPDILTATIIRFLAPTPRKETKQ
ncbi:MAG: hypothetical protein J7647_10395 [Cyanobacteria bacterium SBLK]|nr:hypothetical protein [Cyanobacteria bacterium SBLK]